MFITAETPQSGPPLLPGQSVTYMDAIRMIDPSGNWVQFDYGFIGTAIPPWDAGLVYRPGPISYSMNLDRPNQVPTFITSSDGRRITFRYDQTLGRLLSIEDSAGRVISYEYQQSSDIQDTNLIAVRLSADIVWRYSYYPGAYEGVYAGLVIPAANAARRRLHRITNPTGGLTTYSYGAYDFKRGSLRFAGVRVASKSRSDGSVWRYTYTRGGSGSLDTTVISGPEGDWTYKHFGASHSVANPSPQDVAWKVGTIAEIIDPQGGRVEYIWGRRLLSNQGWYFYEAGVLRDSQNWSPILLQKRFILDGAEYKTVYSQHDAYGRALRTEEIGPNGGARLTSRVYSVDASKWILDRVSQEKSPKEQISRTFDTVGRVILETKNGLRTAYSYDTEGNIVSKTLPNGGVYMFSNYKRGVPQSEVQPEGVQITRVVNEAGKVVAETNGEGYSTRYAYDSLGRPTLITPARGAWVSFSYASNSKSITRGNFSREYVYDGFGRITSSSRGGVQVWYQYDALDRVVFQSNPSDLSAGTRYAYDALGRVTRINEPDGTFKTYAYGPGTTAVTDQRGLTTTYVYRSYGDPSERYLVSVSTPVSAASIVITRDARDLMTAVTQSGFTRSYVYNAHGYLTRVTDPETGVTEYGRDAAGNMTSRTVGSSGTATYVYDGHNRLTSVTYPNNTPGVSYTYNKAHKLLSAQTAGGGGNRSFAYDENGNLVQDTLSIDGYTFTAAYGYDANDQLSSITYPRSGRVVSYAPDVLGRPTQVSGYASSISYWPSGQVRQINYANGLVSSYGTNNRLWPSNFITRKADGTTYSSSSYTYDGLGNLTSISDSVDSSFNRSMSYDGINRLIGISGPWGSGSIAYSGGGNITSQVLGGWALNYNYDSSNRLVSVSGSRNASYTYDALGNIIGGGGSTYGYDRVPNLRCVNCADAVNKIEYTYDGKNHRSSVLKGGIKSYEMYDDKGRQLIEFTPSQSNRLVEYIYLGNKRIAQRVSP
jgi:YD repeat-containing protein